MCLVRNSRSMEQEERIKEKTYDSNPSTSDTRCASLRVLVEIWPTELTKCTPAIHSSGVSSTSRAKSCRCRTRALMTCRLRGVMLGPMVSMTRCVNVGSKRLLWPLVLVGAAPFVPSMPLEAMLCMVMMVMTGYRR